MSFGFGATGFGASSAPFGSTTPSPFGQSQPAFGQAASPFGATATPGVFGQPSQPAFGAAPAPAFGAAAPAFGAASAPAFGAAASAPAFGSTSFGAAQPAFGFGASTPSPFGAPAASAPAFGASAPAFGAASTPAFGAAPSPFGGGFGQASQPAFGAAPAAAPVFGQPTQPAFGAAQGFGGAPAFGAPAAAQRGTRGAAWRKTQETDTSSTGTKSTIYYNSISAMPEYAAKSPEELRWEDYQDGVKGGTGAPAAASGGLFGQASPSASPFGASPFGGSSSPAFGAASTPALPFGAASSPAFGAASAPAFGAFGAASTPAFGAVSTPAFGAAPASAPAFGAFGAASAPAFGAASAPAFGAFGAASTPAFGAASTPAFGAAPASAPAFGSFGAASAPAFGAASAPAFGAFGAASTPAFGAASAPAFGASSSTFSFAGASTPPAFGATSTPAFGAAPAPSPFGAASTPSFGTPGTSLFGGAAAPKSTPGFAFGSTPAFGAASSPSLFGTTTAPAFGAAPSPAFGTGGLFASAQSTPAFSFAPASAATPSLALGALGGQPQQAPVVGGSPYGALPEPPRVTPLPEYKVGLTQRVLAPPSGGPVRPTALIVPRSITPRNGTISVRPRHGGSASRMSRSPAEFLAAAAGGTPPSGITPGSAALAGNGANIFLPRDNPRRLFIREPLPSTEGATAPAVSPAMGGLRTPGSGLRVTPSNGHAATDTSDAAARHNGGPGYGGMGLMAGGGGSSRDLGDGELSALLPSLRRPDYYTEPSPAQLAAMGRENPLSLGEVANFSVGRRGVGSVRWLDPVDVRALDLDSVVALARGSVEVYLDDAAKPEVGSGLNRPAEVTMLKIFKMDKDTGRPTTDAEAVQRFVRKLKRVTAEQGARFVSYDGATGTWKFEVEHFSRYGLTQDDSDDEEAAGGAAPASGAHAERAKRSRDASGVEEEDAGGASDSDSGDDVADFGVRRPAGAGRGSVEGQQGAAAGSKQRSAAAAAEAERGGRGSARAIPAGGDEMDEAEAGGQGLQAGAAVEDGGEGNGFRGPSPGAPLQVALPQRLHAAPEDLQRIREGLYPGWAAQGATQRRTVDIAPAPMASTQPGITGLAPASAARAAAAAAPTSLARRNCWRRAPPPPLRPPVAGTGSRLSPHAAAASSPRLLLPSAPHRVSPGGAVAPSACLVPFPVMEADGRERCLPDAGLMLGASFRVGWGPGGAFVSAGGRPSSAAHVSLGKVIVGSGVVRGAGAEETQRKVRRRLEAQLRLHYDHSRPDLEEGEEGIAAGTAAPRWRLQCSRRGDLRALTQQYIQLCNEHAAEDSGPENAVSRTVLRHQAATWELLHALFSCLPAEIEEQDARAAAAAAGDGASPADGDAAMEEDADGQKRQDQDDHQDQEQIPRLHTLAALQRRAEMSRWVRDRARAAAEGAARVAGAAAAPRLLALLSGHQLAAAAAAAAAGGFPRLATLLVAAGGSSAARVQVAAQLAVWRDTGFEEHIDPQLKQVYQLLAGEVDAVVPSLNLDWRRALGVHIWYALPPTASLQEALASYSAATQAGAAPQPLPAYAACGSTAAAAAAASGALDVCFELLRLHAQDGWGQQQQGAEDGSGGDVGMGGMVSGDDEDRALLLGRLMCPGGVTPDPLDYSFSWHLLCMLRALGVTPDTPAASPPAAAAAAASFVSQLETVGRLAHWAIYAALHLPDPAARAETVQELLARHVQEWSVDAGATTFLLESLRLPPQWLAAARALWARRRGDACAELEDLAAAGDWPAAHTLLCSAVGPRWLLAGGTSASFLSDALTQLEPHRGEIDAAAGAGVWDRGGGVYAGFLYLQQLYESLKTSSTNGGGGEEESGETAALSYEERLEACALLAERLGDAQAFSAGAAGEASKIAATGAARKDAAVQQAAHAHMARELSRWMLGDAHGERAVPGSQQAAIAASVHGLPYSAVAAAVQTGAVSLAASIA